MKNKTITLSLILSLKLSFFLSQVRREVEEAEELLRIAEKKVIQTLKRGSHKIFDVIIYM